MAQRYQVLFKGEILKGFDPARARAEAARLLKADSAQIERLFSGREVCIRGNLPASEAADIAPPLAASACASMSMR